LRLFLRITPFDPSVFPVVAAAYSKPKAFADCSRFPSKFESTPNLLPRTHFPWARTFTSRLELASPFWFEPGLARLPHLPSFCDQDCLVTEHQPLSSWPPPISLTPAHLFLCWIGCFSPTRASEEVLSTLRLLFLFFLFVSSCWSLSLRPPFCLLDSRYFRLERTSCP